MKATKACCGLRNTDQNLSKSWWEMLVLLIACTYGYAIGKSWLSVGRKRRLNRLIRMRGLLC